METGRLFATARLTADFDRNEIAGWLTGFHVDGLSLIATEVGTSVPGGETTGNEEYRLD